ncbi:MAG: hypothetical protein US31_C0003G0009 [Berkelbacteria bacterium GW2011_GWA1_36_9]|uniref:DUF2268 domain-containing protein n=1 Tax=Berkelbacteria bacterium GW2011_GWA1_36_9 TaxID=1618331 RepID=A0A0G0FXI8_9BACT|nr:MAG: hypothetical protein US31_C0003G0009 [Berkelbacteria bacterium GW2011_GWA1_36_9]
MKFVFKISRLDNLYFFISNLTEFHFSCRKHFNKDWVSTTGQLSQKEKRAINGIKPIFKKYGFIVKNNKSLYLGRYFYCLDDQDKWNSLKKYLLMPEYEKMFNGFGALENRFDKIYNENLIKNWKLALEKELSGERFSKLFDFAKKFFNANETGSVLNVHLLMSPSMTWSASGGANLGNNDITLEVPVSNLTDEHIELAAGILLHELSHIWFEESPNCAVAKRLSGKNFSLVKELIIESISPFGFPSQLYSKASNPLKRYLLHNLADGKKAYENFIKNKKTDCQKLDAYLNWLVYPLAACYFLNNKKLDREFIKAVTKIIKKRAT